MGVAASPAYALIGKQGPHSSTCYPLGSAAPPSGGLPPGTIAAALPASFTNGGGHHTEAPPPPPRGLSLTIPGGTGGRTLIYHIICNESAPSDQGPTAISWSQEHPLTYPVEWPHPSGCAKRAPPAQCPAPPRPTAAQLAYQEAEVVAIVCFQMDTYAGTDGDPGCNANNWNKGATTAAPSTFAPNSLNVS
jgi:hypothetical protein